MYAFLNTAGFALLGIAGLIYGVAAWAMESWELRRRLPYPSPLHLWGRGCFCFYVGAALIVTAGLLQRFGWIGP